MIRSGYFELGFVLAFLSPIPVCIAFCFLGSSGGVVAVWICCAACMFCVERGLKHYVAYEVYRADQDAEDLRRLLAMERDAASFEKQTLIEQCQIYETEERTLSARNAELEAKVKDLETRFAELKRVIELDEELEALQDPERPRRLSGGEFSMDDMVDRAIYGHL